MTHISSVLAALAPAWREEAAKLRRLEANAQAAALEYAAWQLEHALRADADEVLTLAQAAEVSGMAKETIRHQVAAGKLPNAGRTHAPRVRRGDLPVRPRKTASTYDPTADALRLMRRG